MIMSRSKEYLKNTIILLIGKFVTQFMTFILMPLYTHCLITSDYGVIDVIQTYISLLIPIITLRFDSAVFRFLIDERENEDGQIKIISNVLILIFIQMILFSIVFIFINSIVKINYGLLILANVPAIMLSNILLQVIRGFGRTKDYSIACIITGIITLVANIVLIIVFHSNAGSILISSTLANLACSLFIFIKLKLYKFIKINKFNLDTLKELVKFSLPMIPNSLSWWIVNVSDRTIISIVIGLAANGIYTVSCKFSNLLNSIFTIFNMSWQEMASIHINDKDRDEFFSTMINQILMFFMSLSLIILAFIPIAFNIIIGQNYYKANNYIPILLFANIFNVFLNLLGAIYLAKKETKKLANTTMISAVINIIINIVFIKKFGLYATSFSTLIAYLGTLIYRIRDVQKYVKFKLDFKRFIISMTLFGLVSISYYINIMFINYITFILTFVLLIVLNKKIIEQFMKGIKNKIFLKNESKVVV